MINQDVFLFVCVVRGLHFRILLPNIFVLLKHFFVLNAKEFEVMLQDFPPPPSLSHPYTPLEPSLLYYPALPYMKVCVCGIFKP